MVTGGVHKAIRPRPPGRIREPGGRTAAPPGIRLVQLFVNTIDIEDSEDEIATASHLRQWLVTHELIGTDDTVTEAGHRRILEFREALRAVLRGHNGDAVPPSAIDVLQMNCNAANLTLTATPDGTLRPTARATGIDGAVGQLLCLVVSAQQDGAWARLKSCRADDCRWAFYDHSRPGSSIWCTMRICGTRQKVRRFRGRFSG